MTQDSLPTVDEVQVLADQGRRKQQEQDASKTAAHRENITETIRKAAGQQKYRVVYSLPHGIADEVINQLCDWVKEHPGYRARWRYNNEDYRPEMVIKIPRKPRRWLFFLRWIPGLGG